MQTILFPADQALALRPAFERFAEGVDYRLPFECVILQFDRPIPEREFFAVEYEDENNPAVLAQMAELWRRPACPSTAGNLQTATPWLLC